MKMDGKDLPLVFIYISIGGRSKSFILKMRFQGEKCMRVSSILPACLEAPMNAKITPLDDIQP